MTQMVSALSVAMFLSILTLCGTASSAADATALNAKQQDEYIGSFCDKHRGADECNNWRTNHTSWTTDDYRNFYRRHQADKEFATPAASELFGFPATHQ